MIKNYKIINLTLEKRIHETTEKEAKEFFEWFIKIIPERLEILKKALKYDGYNQRKMDFSPGSLGYIGDFFAKHVHTRPLTKAEIEEFKKNYWVTIRKQGYDIPLSKIIKIPKETFTDETLSLCWDVGIYFAKVFEKNIKGLKWDFVRKPKNNVYYHLPVLVGFGQNEFSPKDIMEVVAAKIIKGKDVSQELKRLYEVWKYSAEHSKGPFWWEEFVKKDWRKKK